MWTGFKNIFTIVLLLVFFYSFNLYKSQAQDISVETGIVNTPAPASDNSTGATTNPEQPTTATNTQQPTPTPTNTTTVSSPLPLPSSTPESTTTPTTTSQPVQTPTPTSTPTAATSGFPTPTPSSSSSSLPVKDEFICCESSDGVTVFKETRSFCDAVKGKVVSNEICDNSDKKVCCEAGVFIGQISRDECRELRGRIVNQFLCMDTCCKDSQGFVYYTAGRYCPSEQIVPLSTCNDSLKNICCKRDNGEYEYKQKQHCLKISKGTVVEDSFCKDASTRVCCKDKDGKYSFIDRQFCRNFLKGTEVANSFCEDAEKLVCCSRGDTVHLTNNQSCKELMGTAVDESQCKEASKIICCGYPDGFSYEDSKQGCKEAGGQEQDIKECKKLICCHDNRNYYFKRTGRDCKSNSGKIVDDKLCEEAGIDVCCVYSNGRKVLVDRQFCQKAGGDPRDPSECKKKMKN